MMASGTIDEDIYSLIAKKRSVVNRAVEGEEYFSEENASSILIKLLNF
jgi:SNF2 family DNA or RNA helicase